MIIPDVNLLLYATSQGFAEHTRAHRWWEGALNGAQTIGLTEIALCGFIRLATSPRVLAIPMPVEKALGYARDWSARSNAAVLTASRQHLDLAFDLLTVTGTGGNLTTDAQLAAYAIDRDAELHSHDSDFGRFPGLRWVDPLALA